MKLLSCHVDNFGCLSDFNLSFEEGITVIDAHNGFGKTTLAEFLRAMLYGFPRAARDPEKNSRKKYAPWEGGVYGGFLRFSHQGKTYRVHRTFGDTPRQDRFALMDEGTGQISQDFSSDLGLELFGLDADSFARSTYFPQSYPAGEYATPGLLARLTNLIEDTGDLQSFDRAIRTLRASRSACVPYKGSGGTAARASSRISSLQLQIRELEQQQDFFLSQQAELSAAKQALAENKALEASLQNDLLLSSRVSSQEALYRQYLLLSRQLAQTEAELAALVQPYPQGLPTRQEVTQVQRHLQNTPAKGPDPALVRFFAPGIPEESFLTKCQSLWHEISGKQKPSALGFLPGVLLFMGGLCLVPLLLPLAVALLAAGCLWTGAAWYQARTLSRKREELSRLLAPYFGSSTDFGQNLLTLQENVTLYRLQTMPQGADPDPVLEAFSHKYGLSPLEQRKVDGIFEDLLISQRLQQQRKAQKEALTALCPQGVPEKPQQCAESPEALELQLTALRQEIARCTSDIARLEQSCVYLQQQLQSLPELRDQLQRSQEERQEALQRSRLLDLTMEHLQNARQSLSGRYLHAPRQQFGQYMQALLDEDPQGIFLSDQLQVRLQRAGQPRSSAAFSKGQTDLTEFSLRLALADTLFPGEKPLLILDDPFVNLDDTHREKVFTLLRKLSDSYQILYLTCRACSVLK